MPPFLRAWFLSWLSPQFFCLQAQRREWRCFFPEEMCCLGTRAIQSLWLRALIFSGCPSPALRAHVLAGMGLDRLKVSLLPHHHDRSRDDLIRVSQNKDTFSEGFWRKWLHFSFETTRRIFFFFLDLNKKDLNPQSYLEPSRGHSGEYTERKAKRRESAPGSSVLTWVAVGKALTEAWCLQAFQHVNQYMPFND